MPAPFSCRTEVILAPQLAMVAPVEDWRNGILLPKRFCLVPRQPIYSRTDPAQGRRRTTTPSGLRSASKP